MKNAAFKYRFGKLFKVYKLIKNKFAFIWLKNTVKYSCLLKNKAKLWNIITI